MQLIEPKWLKENLAKFRWESNPELCDDRTEHSTQMSWSSHLGSGSFVIDDRFPVKLIFKRATVDELQASLVEYNSSIIAHITRSWNS